MLRIPSKVASVARVEPFVQKVASAYKIEPDIFPNILISITEAVNNAIIHGNNLDESKYVDIQLVETKNGLCFQIKDQGNGFNPSSVPDPTAPENVCKCGGRGVFLMKELSDNVDFSDDGTQVELYFNF